MLFLPGCASYHVGNASLFPCDIQTVYVPIFEAPTSFRRNLGEMLTEAVVKEIQRRTPYTVVNDSNADSILSGRIVGETKRVLVENRYDEPRDLEMALNVQVSWVDRQSNLIRQSDPIPVPLELVGITETAEFVPEIGQSVATAQMRAVQKLAQRIVDMMEQPW